MIYQTSHKVRFDLKSFSRDGLLQKKMITPLGIPSLGVPQGINFKPPTRGERRVSLGMPRFSE